MQLNEAPITVSGNLVADPMLAFTPNGQAYVQLKVASTARRQEKSGEWVDRPTLFLGGTVWGDLAKNVAGSLKKGDRVVLLGELQQHSYQTEDGQNRSRIEMRILDVAASMQWATVQVLRSGRNAVTDTWAAANPSTDGGWPNDETPF